MIDLKYKLIFYSNWHCGSGLAAGADVDALVIKDRYGLPFVPGKTIKGLVREALEDILYFTDKSNKKTALLIEAFGNSEDRDNRSEKMLSSDDDTTSIAMRKGCIFFTNAELPAADKKAIIDKKLNSYLYITISSTAIEKDGIAKDSSLRKLEVTAPCTLEGEILNIPDALSEDLKKALQMVKRLGVNRNRGLGRCEFKVQ